MSNQKFLKAISKLKICVGPFIQSTIHAKVPFYFDNRDIYSHPEILKIAVNELGKVIKKYQKQYKIDLLVGIPLAGIPLAMALSVKTSIPFAYMNNKRKKFLKKRVVEGDYPAGARAILLDDALGFGETKLKAIRDCADDNVVVKHIICLNNAWWPANKKLIKRLAKMGITFDALFTRIDWNNYLYKNKVISKNAFEIQKAYLANPGSWHKKEEIWQKFLRCKKIFLKTGNL